MATKRRTGFHIPQEWITWAFRSAILLLAMWIAHYFLFRAADWMAWIGTVVVVDNVISSLVRSSLFDFTPGWIYVFGVGVVGGTVLRRPNAAAD